MFIAKRFLTFVSRFVFIDWFSLSPVWIYSDSFHEYHKVKLLSLPSFMWRKVQIIDVLHYVILARILDEV